MLFSTFSFDSSSSSKSIDFSKDIAPIIYENCSGCHHTGGIGPMSLVSYSEVYNNRSLVEYSISNGSMPPWPPDTSYSRFSHERVLSSVEISTIQSWVNSGAPQGDSTLAPPYPSYITNGPTLGPADLTISAPVYTSNAVNHDDYVCFVIPSGLTQGRKIKAVEVEPGNREIVHHSLIYIDTSSSFQTDTSGHCMGPTTSSAKLIGEYAPGSLPTIFPGDSNLAFGVGMEAGSNIILSMHYPYGSAGQQDSTKLHLYFYPSNVSNFREVYIAPVIQNWNFCIPPNQIQTINATFPTNGTTIPSTFSLFGIFPHMHLLGKSINCYSVGSNNDTLNLISVPSWDFEWQGFYKYKYPQIITQGSTVYAHATYDNTTSNSHNPNNPPELVCAGTNTSDEMFMVYMMFMSYQAGDENLNLDSLAGYTTSSNNQTYPEQNQIISVYPNPSNGQLNFSFTCNQTANVRLKIMTINGQSILDKNYGEFNGQNTINWKGRNENGKSYPSGIYIYGLEINNRWNFGKLILK